MNHADQIANQIANALPETASTNDYNLKQLEEILQQHGVQIKQDGESVFSFQIANIDITIHQYLVEGSDESSKSIYLSESLGEWGFDTDETLPALYKNKIYAQTSAGASASA